jgi:hypothetical protein
MKVYRHVVWLCLRRRATNRLATTVITTWPDHIDEFLPKIVARNIKFAGDGTIKRANPPS